MNILVTNDDGVNAPGLWHLAEAMRDLGQVTVVAPDREQSGVGTSISLAKAVRMHKLPYSMEGIETYTVEGTPGDAVIMGAAHLLKGQTIDLVVSGVNHGHNTGAETFLSGTVGAAWHGRQRNIPAIAVSAGYKTPYTGNSLFAVGAGMAAVLAQQIRRGAIPNDVLYNVNVPFCKPEEVRGLLLTRSSYGTYADEVREENDGRGRDFYYVVFKRAAVDKRKGTEAWALEHHYLSLTLLDKQLSPLRATLLPKDFAERAFDQLMQLMGRDWPTLAGAGVG